MIESLLLGLMMILPLAFAVVYFAQLQREAIAVNSASREAVRAYVTAPNAMEGAARARAAADGAIRGGSLDPARSTLVVDGPLTRGAPVRATVRYRSESSEIPLISTLGPVEISATHTEIVDRHRSLAAFSGARGATEVAVADQAPSADRAAGE